MALEPLDDAATELAAEYGAPALPPLATAVPVAVAPNGQGQEQQPGRGRRRRRRRRGGRRMRPEGAPPPQA